MRILPLTFEQIDEVWFEMDMWYYVNTNMKRMESNPYSNRTYIGGRSEHAGNPVFYCYVEDEILMGVNSYSHVNKTECRSRGLYVYPDFRGSGVGEKLLRHAIEENRDKGYEYIWSMPRLAACKVYERAGYTLTTEPFDMGVYQNRMCRYDY
tara:strand:- start:1123 stop:1578 length:456 start_codon:yes stop_codon:yes gene_type:complete